MFLAIRLVGTRIAVPMNEAMMALRWCTFRARPGREAAVLDRLRYRASRPGHGDEMSLLLCGTDDPGEFMWMGAAAARLGPESVGVIDSMTADLVGPVPVFSLRFVGGWHRLPAPPFRIWNVEVRAAVDLSTDIITELFVPRAAGRAEPVVGRSVFRAIGDAALFIGFVGLTLSWLRQHPVPRHANSRGAIAIWRPLSVLYRAETFGGGVESRLGSLWSSVAPAPVAAATGISP